MGPIVGWLILGSYAILLGVGGVFGYLKASSRPSLIAGLVSAAVALLALGWSIADRRGFTLGAVLAAFMLAFFGVRFAHSRKFMPGGLLLAASTAVLVLLSALLLSGNAG